MRDFIIEIEAPAPVDIGVGLEVAGPNRGSPVVQKKGTFIQWGCLHLTDSLTDSGLWDFSPTFAAIEHGDDFWGLGPHLEPIPDISNPGPMDYWQERAEGRWENQFNMNLLHWAEKPRQRLAMTLLGFHALEMYRDALRIGQAPDLKANGAFRKIRTFRGIGTMMRGNMVIRRLPGNAVVGPVPYDVIERTDGQTLSLRWNLLEIRSFEVRYR
jgi:hypothetical protein